jgi:hypothetical protein
MKPLFEHIRPAYVAALLFLLMAVVLGTLVAVYWRAEYMQCLAEQGGIRKVITGTCAALP